MKKIAEMSNDELENELIAMEEMIENCGYGTKDLMYRDQLEREVTNRGGEIFTTLKVKWNEVEEDEDEDEEG